MPDTTEEWKWIEGYNGFYQISTEGRVRSVARTDPRGNLVRQRLMKLIDDGRGYMVVSLFKNGHGKRRYVHQLVLEAFISQKKPGMMGCHANNIRSDNKLSNLRWGTADDNAADRMKHGTMPAGEKHWRSKLTNKQREAIGLARRRGEPRARLAIAYGISDATVCNVARAWMQNNPRVRGMVFE